MATAPPTFPLGISGAVRGRASTVHLRWVSTGSAVRGSSPLRTWIKTTSKVLRPLVSDAGIANQHQAGLFGSYFPKRRFPIRLWNFFADTLAGVMTPALRRKEQWQVSCSSQQRLYGLLYV